MECSSRFGKLRADRQYQLVDGSEGTNHARLCRLVGAVGRVEGGDRPSRIGIDTIDRIGAVSRGLDDIHISAVRSLVVCEQSVRSDLMLLRWRRTYRWRYRSSRQSRPPDNTERTRRLQHPEFRSDSCRGAVGRQHLMRGIQQLRWQSKFVRRDN